MRSTLRKELEKKEHAPAKYLFIIIYIIFIIFLLLWEEINLIPFYLILIPFPPRILMYCGASSLPHPSTPEG